MIDERKKRQAIFVSAMEAAFGPNWHEPGAFVLGTGEHVVRRWESGEAEVPTRALKAMEGFLVESATECLKAREAIVDFLDPPFTR